MRTYSPMNGTAALALCLSLSMPLLAHAAGPGGAVVATPPPASLLPGAFESDTHIALITEQTNYTLPSDVFVDSDGTPGVYDGIADVTVGTLPAGSRVDVHLLHFDPVSATRPPVRLVGSVTFSQPIIGMAFRRPSLDASDIHGAPGTEYPTLALPSFREFEFGFPGSGVADSAEISPDRLTLSLNWGATRFIDQLRVFTAVPEPSGVMIAAMAVAGIMLRRRTS